MPNPLSVLRHLVPRRITPDMLAMDADGITGQQLQDQPQPLPGDPGGPSVQPPPESSLPPRPQLPQDPQSRQALPNSAFAGAGVPQGGVQDPTINRIAQEGLNAPQLPPRPSGWRQALGVTASMLGGAAFDPLIEYGAKGARQMADYNRWKSELPERVAVGKMYTDQQHAENSSRQADETRQLREFQQHETELTRQQNEQDTFLRGGGQLLPARPMGGVMNVPSHTITPTQGLAPAQPSASMPIPGAQAPKPQPRSFTPPGQIPSPPPINQPQSLTVPQGQITAEPGRIATPVGSFDTTTPQVEQDQGLRRAQKTGAQIAKEKDEAAQVNWPIATEGMAAAVPELGLKVGQRIEPEYAKGIVEILKEHAKSPKLHFEHFTDDNTGDVTTIGYDEEGHVKSTDIQRGIAKKRPNNTIINNEANHEFQMAEVGRKALDKAEGTYRTAAQSADELSGFIDAARAGNKVSAQAVPLEGTLAIITSQGVKRINRTEVESIQGAGSLFDTLMGKVGKLVSGQPLPNDIQEDFKKLADLLKKSAYKTYKDTHSSTVKRYGLKDEQPLPDPSAAVSGPGGVPAVGGTFNGQKVLKVERVQ